MTDSDRLAGRRRGRMGDEPKLTCERCGKILLLDEDVRYTVRIEVVAAYDPMELSREDVTRDHRGEIERLIDSMSRRDPAEVEESVYALREYQVCPACRKAILADPLGAGGSAGD